MNRAKIFIAFPFLLAFAVCASAQADPIPRCLDFTDLLKIGPKKIENLELGFSAPNELEGYKFFKEGKLKGLKLGISTKENVKEIFDKDCEGICEYDNDWRIVFTYLKNITKEVMENGTKKKLIADPQSANKIYSIKLIPKNRISFKDVEFPEEFYKSHNVAFGHDFHGNATGSSIDVYTDSYGLRYSIFDKEDYSTLNEKNNRQNSDLILIEYKIPDELEENLFIQQK